jgi:hypothetical protein
MKLDPAAATAAAHLWECNAHGPLPLSRFSIDDLSRRQPWTKVPWIRTFESPVLDGHLKM